MQAVALDMPPPSPGTVPKNPFLPFCFVRRPSRGGTFPGVGGTKAYLKEQQGGGHPKPYSTETPIDEFAFCKLTEGEDGDEVKVETTNPPSAFHTLCATVLDPLGLGDRWSYHVSNVNVEMRMEASWRVPHSSYANAARQIAHLPFTTEKKAKVLGFLPKVEGSRLGSLCNFRGTGGETLLHWAALMKNYKAMFWLLKLEPMLLACVYTSSTYRNENVLHILCSHGDAHVIRRLARRVLFWVDEKEGCPGDGERQHQKHGAWGEAEEAARAAVKAEVRVRREASWARLAELERRRIEEDVKEGGDWKALWMRDAWRAIVNGRADGKFFEKPHRGGSCYYGGTPTSIAVSMGHLAIVRFLTVDVGCTCLKCWDEIMVSKDARKATTIPPALKELYPEPPPGDASPLSHSRSSSSRLKCWDVSVTSRLDLPDRYGNNAGHMAIYHHDNHHIFTFVSALYSAGFGRFDVRVKNDLDHPIEAAIKTAPLEVLKEASTPPAAAAASTSASTSSSSSTAQSAPPPRHPPPKPTLLVEVRNVPEYFPSSSSSGDHSSGLEHTNSGRGSKAAITHDALSLALSALLREDLVSQLCHVEGGEEGGEGEGGASKERVRVRAGSLPLPPTPLKLSQDYSHYQQQQQGKKEVDLWEMHGGPSEGDKGDKRTFKFRLKLDPQSGTPSPILISNPTTGEEEVIDHPQGDPRVLKALSDLIRKHRHVHVKRSPQSTHRLSLPIFFELYGNPTPSHFATGDGHAEAGIALPHKPIPWRSLAAASHATHLKPQFYQQHFFNLTEATWRDVRAQVAHESGRVRGDPDQHAQYLEWQGLMGIRRSLIDSVNAEGLTPLTLAVSMEKRELFDALWVSMTRRSGGGLGKPQWTWGGVSAYNFPLDQIDDIGQVMDDLATPPASQQSMAMDFWRALQLPHAFSDRRAAGAAKRSGGEGEGVQKTPPLTSSAFGSSGSSSSSSSGGVSSGSNSIKQQESTCPYCIIPPPETEGSEEAKWVGAEPLDPRTHFLYWQYRGEPTPNSQGSAAGGAAGGAVARPPLPPSPPPTPSSVSSKSSSSSSSSNGSSTPLSHPPPSWKTWREGWRRLLFRLALWWFPIPLSSHIPRHPTATEVLVTKELWRMLEPLDTVGGLTREQIFYAEASGAASLATTALARLHESEELDSELASSAFYHHQKEAHRLIRRKRDFLDGKDVLVGEGGSPSVLEVLAERKWGRLYAVKFIMLGLVRLVYCAMTTYFLFTRAGSSLDLVACEGDALAAWAATLLNATTTTDVSPNSLPVPPCTYYAIIAYIYILLCTSLFTLVSNALPLIAYDYFDCRKRGGGGGRREREESHHSPAPHTDFERTPFYIPPPLDSQNKPYESSSREALLYKASHKGVFGTWYTFTLLSSALLLSVGAGVDLWGGGWGNAHFFYAFGVMSQVLHLMYFLLASERAGPLFVIVITIVFPILYKWLLVMTPIAIAFATAQFLFDAGPLYYAKSMHDLSSSGTTSFLLNTYLGWVTDNTFNNFPSLDSFKPAHGLERYPRVGTTVIQAGQVLTVIWWFVLVYITAICITSLLVALLSNAFDEQQGKRSGFLVERLRASMLVESRMCGMERFYGERERDRYYILNNNAWMAGLGKYEGVEQDRKTARSLFFPSSEEDFGEYKRHLVKRPFLVVVMPTASPVQHHSAFPQDVPPISSVLNRKRAKEGPPKPPPYAGFGGDGTAYGATPPPPHKGPNTGV